MASLFSRQSVANRLSLLAAFGIAFGHIEAVVVVYIRRLLGWVPLPADITAEDLLVVPPWLIHTEQTREAATIIVIVALTVLVGRNFLEKLATFLFTFGVWDITYYIALKAMIRWPESFSTLDCLFLIPEPWIAPVWLPLISSLGMVLMGTGVMIAIDRRSASKH
ncbi:MAG: hypothetical protein ACUVX8_12880 [Candidatus Zipacnadales bacterium]